uniref:CCHC-type domain-containing protein n=1 Tax=Dendroctonus ponderosae TaxID=77166 RepID=A0AAR5P2T7_DENPD
MTDEQFAALLSRLSVQPSTSPVPMQTGNFSKCSTSFDGAKDSDVNAFIDAIGVYKDCTNISDQNALRGLPMLLDGFAATWFQGVKSSLTDWNRALILLRTTFPSDIFICKARAVLAQLPNDTLTEATQIDMIYGLLHRRVREKVPRDKVSSFEELLTQARLAEETFEAPVYRQEDNRSLATKDKFVRCTYCKNPGHEKEECRKFKNYQERRNGNITTHTQQTPNQATFRAGTSAGTQPSSNPSITCYGCGAPGVIRS